MSIDFLNVLSFHSILTLKIDFSFHPFIHSFSQMEPLGNKTDSEDFTAGVPLKCPEKVSLNCIIIL